MRPSTATVWAAWAALAGAGAEPGVARADRALVAGVDLRTDLGTEFARITAGLVSGPSGVTLVLDPVGYRRGLQHDTDLLLERMVGRAGWSAMAGWRFEVTDVLGARYRHHKPLVGVSAPMPMLLGGRVRARFTGEQVSLYSSGGALPDLWLWDRDGVVRNGLGGRCRDR
jgi:hypothetical protein